MYMHVQYSTYICEYTHTHTHTHTQFLFPVEHTPHHTHTHKTHTYSLLFSAQASNPISNAPHTDPTTMPAIAPSLS